MFNVTFDMSNNQMIVHRKKTEPWTVTLLDKVSLSIFLCQVKTHGKYWNKLLFVKSNLTF